MKSLPEQAAQARRRRIGLEASARAAVAPHPFGLDRHVAEFRRHPTATMDQLAIDDEAATDPGSEREQHHVFASARRTAPVLAERPRIRIVLDDHRALEHCFQMTAQGKAPPRFDVRRGIHDAGANVKRARNRYANRERASEAAPTRLILQRAYLARNVRDRFGSAAFCTRRRPQHQEHLTIFGNRGGADIGAAHVEADHVIALHLYFQLSLSRFIFSSR